MTGSSRQLSILVAFLLLTSCDSSPPADVDAGGADSGPPPVCQALPPFEVGDANGHADPLGAAVGQARVGRLDASELPADRTGLGVWEAGDFVLSNGRFALIVEDAGDSDLYDPHGGRPVGVARVEGGALVDAGDFNEILLGFGDALLATERVTVMNDGADGGTAVLRATGLLAPVDFAGDLLTGLVTGDFTGMPGALDYELAPGSDGVDIYLELGTDVVRGARAPFLIAAFFQRYRMPIWTEALGFVQPTDPVPMVAFVDDAATSYAWVAAPDRPLRTLLDVSGVLAFSMGGASVPGCDTARLHLGTMVLGGPGLPGLQQSLARERGETLRTVTGSVTESDGAPASDVRVHVQRADGRHFARITPSADGTFALDVPAESVSFLVHREGQALFGPVEVGAGQGSVVLALPAFGTIEVGVTTTERPAQPLPARVQVIPTGTAPSVPAALGERTHGSRAHVAFTTTGAVSLRVDPGEHRVIVSRGYEYELVNQTVTVSAGATERIDAELEHVVDTTGVMCADYHIHTHRSPDSPDSPELKLAGLIADGLEIPVRSDHEWVNDFQPLIEALGLEQYAFGIGGEELTTFAWGHFGVFPLTEDRSRPNGSAVPWVGRLPPAVFAEARARPEAPAFIINHPRSGGAFGGYFVAAGFDPSTGSPARLDYWDEEFTLVEVFNDGNMDRHANVVADWFALLNSGRRVFAIGSSDSHGIFGSPVGYPRTCLALGTDDPRALTPNMVRDVTGAGHSTISGGLFISVVGPGGTGPGDEVSGAGASAMFDVTVQAPCWIRATQLEVIVDGTTVETIEIPTLAPAECDALRFEASGATGIAVPVAAEGSWVVFHASGDMDLSPVHPGRMPFAVSNPVFLRR